MKTIPALLVLMILGEVCQSNNVESLPEGNGREYMQAIIGSTIKMKCPKGQRGEFFNWKKEGKPNLHIIGNLEQNSKTGTLKIKSVTQEDAGTYTCSIVGGQGSSLSFITRLVVIISENDTSTFVKKQDKRAGNPQFSNPGDMSRPEREESIGARLSLKCRASGTPKPKYMWFKDNVRLTIYDDRDELVIVSVKTSDAGNYKCIAANTHGRIDFLYKLQVLGRLTKPKVILQSPSNLSISQGQTVLLQCEVKSDEKPTIMWLKEGLSPSADENIHIGQKTYQVIKVDEVEMLTHNSYSTSYKIHDFSSKDASYYVCRAGNSVGYSHQLITVKLNRDAYSSKNEDSFLETTSITMLVGIPVAIVSIIVIIASLTIYKRHTNAKQNQSQTSHLQPTRSPLSSVPSGYSAGSTSLKQTNSSLQNHQIDALQHMDPQQQLMYNQQQSIAQQQQNLAQQQYFLQQQRMQYQNAMISAHQYQLSNDQSNAGIVTPANNRGHPQQQGSVHQPSSSSCSQGYQPIPVAEPLRPAGQHYTDSYSESDHSHNPVYNNQYGV